MPTWNMAPAQGGIQVLDSLQLNDQVGTAVTGLSIGTTTLDPASINTVSQGTVTFTLTGARSGDLVFVVPPSSFDPRSALVGARVTSNDTVTVYINNPSAGSSDSASGSWQYIWFKLS